MAIRWTIVVLATLALGFAFDNLNVPAAWILAAIVASAGLALSTSKELPVHPLLKRVSRSLIAIIAAAPIAASDPKDLAHFILPGLVISAITIGIGIAGGLLLAKQVPEISRETGVLSMLAGGASIMPTLAEQMGADYRYVTLTQYLRLLTVTITLPLLVPLMDVPHGEVTHPQAEYNLLAIIAIVIIGEPLAQKLRFPAAGILGPMLLTVLASLFAPITLPAEIKLITFAVIGWTAGGMLSVPALKLFAKQLPATFAFIFILLGACALSAVGLMYWLDSTYFEAYLASSPGALETVLALVDEFGAGPAIAAIQVIRLVAILLIAGYLPKLLGSQRN